MDDLDDNSSVSDFELESAGPLKPGAERPYYNDKEGMEIKVKELDLKSDWLEYLAMVTDMTGVTLPGIEPGDNQPLAPTGTIEDDFKREMRFYCQAQVAAKNALGKLRNLGIQTARPEDYFAEMVKTDAHMQKVRSKMLERKQNLEASEKAKKQRQLKKFGKKVQQEVLQKRQTEKKEAMKNVDRIKKGKDKLKQRNDADPDGFNISTDKKRAGMKRKHKDAKFGFGGKKRMMKKNTAESSKDALSSFKPAIHGKANPRKFANKNSKSKAKRLGKSRRMRQNQGKGKRR